MLGTCYLRLSCRLEDSTTRNILLDRTYDFTDTEVDLSVELGLYFADILESQGKCYGDRMQALDLYTQPSTRDQRKRLVLIYSSAGVYSQSESLGYDLKIYVHLGIRHVQKGRDEWNSCRLE